MSRRPRRPFAAVVRVAVLAAALMAIPSAFAKTTGVAEDPTVQSGPCYDALVDKNAATPTTAPNRELGAACQAEHGDVDKAWARVVRLWGSDSVDLPDYSSYRPADAPLDGTLPRWLAFVGVVLAYAALGTPMRAAARLMRAIPGPASGAALDLLACLVLRGLILAALVALIGLPYLAAVCALLLILRLALDRDAGPARPAPGSDGIATGALARHLAELVNDILGALAGLAALALFVQHVGILFGVAWVLAIAVSAPPILAARRALRTTRIGTAALRALLAAAIGEALILTPPLSAWLGGQAGMAIAVPAILAALTLAPGLRAGFPTVSPAE